MKDLKNIAQLLFSPDESSKEIGLFLIKSQGVDIDLLGSYIESNTRNIIKNHIDNIIFPNPKKEIYESNHFDFYSQEVFHFNFSFQEVFIHVRIITRYLDSLRLDHEILLEVWDDSTRHKSGYIDGELAPITIDEAVEKFTKLVIENLKTL